MLLQAAAGRNIENRWNPSAELSNSTLSRTASISGSPGRIGRQYLRLIVRERQPAFLSPDHAPKNKDRRVIFPAVVDENFEGHALSWPCRASPGPTRLRLPSRQSTPGRCRPRPKSAVDLFERLHRSVGLDFDQKLEQ